MLSPSFHSSISLIFLFFFDLEPHEGKGPFLGANRPFVIEFDNVVADGSDQISTQFTPKIGNHAATDSWDKYKNDDLLIIIDNALHWVEVTVQHKVRFSRYMLCQKIPLDSDGNTSMEMVLNGANHFCPLLSLKTYEAGVKLYLQRLRKENTTLTDNITLDHIDAEDMLVGLKLGHADLNRPQQRGGLSDIYNVRSLCDIIAVPENKHRRRGCHSTHPVIIRGDSGSGKTWACKQMAYMLSYIDPDDDFAQESLSYRYIPLLLSVHTFARLLKLEPGGSCKPSEVIGLYSRAEACGEHVYNMLMDAYTSKRLFIIIDGIDDVPHLSLLMQRVIFDVLIPGQHKFVASSKPVGVESELYRVGFGIFDLQPLTKRQQKAACSALLDNDAAEFTANMFGYLQNRGDQDALIEPLRDNPALKELEEMGSFERPSLVTRWLLQDKTFVEKERDWDDCSGVAEAKSLAAKAGSGQTDVNGEMVIDLRQVVVNTNQSNNNFDSNDIDYNEPVEQPPILVMTIVSTVEELMEGATMAKAVLAESMKKIAKRHHMPIFHGRGSQRSEGTVAVILHPMEPITRIDAIAQERYGSEVSSGRREGPAIAWSTDAVRATMLCNSPRMMLTLLSELQEMPRLNVVRATNYFSDLDPTHYRRLTLVIKVDVGDGTRHFVEVTMQLVCVFENMPNTQPCTYFKTMFGPEIAADSALRGANDGWARLAFLMEQWVALMSSPIVLSLMIVLFRQFNYKTLEFVSIPVNDADIFYHATIAIVRRGVNKSISKLESIISSAAIVAGHCGDTSPAGLRVTKAASVMHSSVGSTQYPRYDSRTDDNAEFDKTDSAATEMSSVVEPTPAEAVVLMNNQPDLGRIIRALGLLAHANHLHRGTVRSAFSLNNSAKYFGKATELSDALNWFAKIGGDPQHMPGFVLARYVDSAEKESTLMGGAVWMDQLYECTHSSFQEHLCSEHLSVDLHKGTHIKSVLQGEGGLSSFVNGQRHFTLFNVARGGLARGLFGHAGRAYFQNIGINAYGLRNLFSGSWLKNLRVLDLSHNGLSADAGPLVESAVLNYFSCLQSLQVDGNDFTFSTRVALFQWAHKEHGRKLELDGGNEKLHAALRASDKDASIVHLDLSSCKLCEADSDWLVKVLADSTTVRSAHLWSNQLGPKCGAALANVISGVTSLNELILYNNSISGQGAVAIAKAVADNKSLMKLDLERNALGDDAGMCLARSLMKNRVLSVIHLQRGMLGEKTGMLLAEVLAAPSCNISDLKLDWNHLGNQAVAALGSALKLNRALRHLSLRSVGMNDQAACVIARALAANTSLATLQLGSNHLGKQAGEAFAGTLVVNASMTKLVLANNNLGDAAGQAIAKAIGMAQFPRKINVESNGFSKKTKSDLAKAKKKYPACRLRF